MTALEAMGPYLVAALGIRKAHAITDTRAVVNQLEGWSCPWATHQTVGHHNDGTTFRHSWPSTRYFVLHG